MNLLNSLKVLIVTDKNIVKIGLIEKLESYLDKFDINYQVYSKVEPKPSIETIDELMNNIRSSGIDTVIGFGGGSCLDAAKAASIANKNPGHIGNCLGLNLVREKVPILFVFQRLLALGVKSLNMQ